MYIFRPLNLRELLSYIYLNPEAFLLAGGVTFLPSLKGPMRAQYLPEKLVDLTTVGELLKINKTMRYLDLGAALSLSRILGIRYHVVPIILHNALKSVSGPALRNLATLGGNICQASAYSSIIPALSVLDAHLEIRSYTAFRWEPISTFFKATVMPSDAKDARKAEAAKKSEVSLAAREAGSNTDEALAGVTSDEQKHTGQELTESMVKPAAARTSLARDEIVARIRVPLDNWNVQVFKKISTDFNSPQAGIIFCGLAQVAKGVIEDFRFSFGAVNRSVYRNRNLEKPFIGRKVPLQPKDIDFLKESLSEQLAPIADHAYTAAYRKKTAVKLIEWFLKSLKPL
jgi:CO/xanthine dehydrogenase FAD-binding subunit